MAGSAGITAASESIASWYVYAERNTSLTIALHCWLVAETTMHSDVYSKVSANLNGNLAYFPPMHDPNYSTNNRITALQHQLHISTTTCALESAAVNTWSNLIIPYHSQTDKHMMSLMSSEANRVVEMAARKEDKKDVKKKNPYSIEELLKRPCKKAKPISVNFTGVEQPFGVIVTAEEFPEDGRGESGMEKDIKVDVEC